MEPITRKETFLAKAAGQNVETPEPITRVEHFLKNLIDHISQIGSGGGGGGGSDASCLPEVTTDDNGAFLRVVDGAWAVATIESAEGVGF